MARDADGVGCSSRSSGSTKRRKYDVFLSFRGEDTWKNFTNHLYAALKNEGLRTFRDEEGLERGESINPSLVEAIEESRFAIIVLSPNYASSTWCLDELQKILQLKEETSLQVFPIFYGVHPSDVRKQNGSFAEAFIRHEERFVKDKTQEWRDALEKVATLSGWDSKNRYETEFIESIADEIGSKLLDKSASDLGKLIGIEPKLDELNSIIARESEEVGFIGIWGAGGVGKTTLARAFYEREQKRKSKNFEIHCFLDNIRETCEKHGLISLQRKLLLSLYKRSIEVADFYEAMELIKRKLTDREILLVLDDVSHVSQLEKLAPRQGWFSKGSIIVITTRDKHLLSSYRVSDSAIYHIELLSDSESLKLFIQNAFKEGQPNEDYLNLARTVIEYTGGLPLALEVLGSFLCKRTIEEWEDALAKFEKGLPEDISKILEVSLHGLELNEKTIFLDIACFFNGMDEDHIIQILETLDKDLHPKIGIRLLIDKSLVINYKGRLWVHEILQNMAKHVVHQESSGDASKLSRILSLDDANHVLGGNKVTFEKYLIKTPNFDGIPHLEKLILQGCSNLVKIHQSLGQHKKLVTVDLKDCKEVKTLPEKFEMNSLETFILSGCSKVRKLPEFGKDMACLSKLDLEKTALAKLPQSLGNLIGLVELNLTNCKKLVCLPCSVGKLKALKITKLSNCSNLSGLPENLNENEALKELDLSGIAIKELSFSGYNGEAQSSSTWSCLSLL
ncbi:TMV resistance protein N-like [Neltuma alba]|uniref:TMV resistance protein N-like n=1 Tax=Neltuma alba TaxID=207710 RepID=UPI0010A58722|nr:TMV resistance protein N-like [Prosopis alba]